MIKIEHVVLASPEQLEFVIEGMRNPMNSWIRYCRVRSWQGRSFAYAALIQCWYGS